MRSFSLADFLSLLSALQWTAVLVLIALGLGAPLALLLALMRTSASRALRWTATAFLQLVQGVPLLGLLMFFYFGMPVFLGIEMPPLVAVGIAMTVYTASFLGEIWRGGIEAVKHEQWEAAACLGLSTWHQFRYVIAPQAFRMALPPTVGFLVQLIKGTSLASIVGFVELARAGQLVSAATFQPLLVYSIVAAIYFAACLPLTLWARSLEVRLNGARGHPKRYQELWVDPGAQGGVARHQGRRDRHHHRQVGLRQIDPAPLHQRAGAHRRRRDHGGGPAGAHRHAEPARLPPARRHRLPGLQPVPAHDGGAQHHAGPGPQQADRQGGRPGAGAGRAGARRAGRQDRLLSGPAVRRAAAARCHRPLPRHAPAPDAVRRGDLGARPRTGRRGAEGDGGHGAPGHDHGPGHPRDGLRPQRRLQDRLHAPGPRLGRGAAGRALRQPAHPRTAELHRLRPLRRGRAIRRANHRFLARTGQRPEQKPPEQRSNVVRLFRTLAAAVAVCATVALSAAALPSAAKADALQNVLSAGKLRVGVLMDAAPWGFKDAKGEAAGLDIDLAKLMAADMGVKLDLVQVTGANRIPSLLANKVDVLIAAAGATPERAQQVTFTQPYAAVNLGVYGPKSMATASDPEGLKGRSIGVAKGSTLDIWLTDNAPGAKLVRFEDTPGAIAAYLAGQVDTFAENSAIALKVAQDNPGKEVELKFLIRQSPAHVAVRHGEQDFVNWINTFLFYNRLNGKLGALQMTWFKEKQTLPQM